jgi:hypothetical protein
MITRSMKRIVLTILEASRDVTDVWNRKRNTEQNRQDFNKAMARLERAVLRLDRMKDAN